MDAHAGDAVVRGRGLATSWLARLNLIAAGGSNVRSRREGRGCLRGQVGRSGGACGAGLSVAEGVGGAEGRAVLEKQRKGKAGGTKSGKGAGVWSGGVAVARRMHEMRRG